MCEWNQWIMYHDPTDPCPWGCGAMHVGMEMGSEMEKVDVQKQFRRCGIDNVRVHLITVKG
jgi:hypothetical protein